MPLVKDVCPRCGHTVERSLDWPQFRSRGFAQHVRKCTRASEEELAYFLRVKAWPRTVLKYSPKLRKMVREVLLPRPKPNRS